MAKAKKRLSEDERATRGLPTAAREAHGAFEPVNAAVVDARGDYSRPRVRAVDCLDSMLKRQTITVAMRDAGAAFRDAFAKAQLEPLKACDPTSLRGQMDRTRDSAGNPARRRVWTALQRLGGLNSPAGSCAWHVLGEQQNLKDWAELRGWARNPHVATGILIGTLGALAGEKA